MSDRERVLIERWREDAAATYHTWFLWGQRLKNFRSIRRGLGQVRIDIETGSFGNAYRGSSLETVVGSIAEQRQMFKGADHAFLWKPKLRIPDIYENRENQLSFGRMLGTCLCCGREDQVIAAVRELDGCKIKGLGPAVANLLYFLHPTIMPPFNTAIVNGYNALTGARVRLGRWDDYLAMRQGIFEFNARHRDLLSNDLGAAAGLLFDVGGGRYAVPPLADGGTALQTWEDELARIRADGAKAAKAAASAREGDRSHTEVQAWLRDLGKALGYDVWVAANDRNRSWNGGRLGDGCLDDLPLPAVAPSVAETVRLIDVLWLDGPAVAAAFEVEHTTSIYSGIVRLLDLALSGETIGRSHLFLVAPDEREQEVRQQLQRPAFLRVRDMRVRYLPYGELSRHRDAMARFGQGMKAIEAVARELV